MSGSPSMDSRAVWLRSLGWRETEDGWTGAVTTTGGARYTPMSLDDAFDVAVARSVIDKALRVEVAGAHVRLDPMVGRGGRGCVRSGPHRGVRGFVWPEMGSG
jgi:hypothetical protein